MYYFRFFKRPLDIIVTVILLIFIWPILLLCAVLIKIDSKGPILFVQERVGMGGKIFKILKFRTMTDKKRNLHEQIFSDNPEITKIGAILRRTKFDELPQLFNVLSGEMSIVGPRPCLLETVKKFNEDGFARLKVRGGVTNLAAVNGSIFLTWPERWKYDRYYVENVTFKMDVYIILKTIAVQILGEKYFYKKDKI